MEPLKGVIDELVSVGIRSYISLLGHGERTRSRRLFMDVLQLSALMSGGPSARMSPVLVAEGTQAHPMRTCLVLLTLRSILATLLALRASIYWQRVPELAELHTCCVDVAGRVGESSREGAARRGRRASGRTATELNCKATHETDTVRGCRRNDALPTIPELAEPSAELPKPTGNRAQIPAL